MHMQAIPEGYLRDAQGRLVPREMVKEIDLARDALVAEIVANALSLSAQVKSFKEKTMADIEAFVQLSAERFGASLGGDKGNITLRNFDGSYKVCRDIDERLVFDERLQVAKALIDECIVEWSDGARAELRALITDAFQVDKQGRVNTKRILALKRVNIEHETWKRAMDAIAESVQVAATRAYVRIYERQDDGTYRQINLDLAAV